MSNLEIFKKDNWKIRSMIIDGKPYFVGNDVARNLGYKSPGDAVTYHCKGIYKINIPSKGGNQETRMISEFDLYRLIMKSKLKTAEKFQDWVFEEVLPSIRKYGMYAKDELLDNPDLLIEVITKYKIEKQKKLEIENKRKQLNSKYEKSYHVNAGKIGSRQRHINILKKEIEKLGKEIEILQIEEDNEL